MTPQEFESTIAEAIDAFTAHARAVARKLLEDNPHVNHVAHRMGTEFVSTYRGDEIDRQKFPEWDEVVNVWDEWFHPQEMGVHMMRVGGEVVREGNHYVNHGGKIVDADAEG